MIDCAVTAFWGIYKVLADWSEPRRLNQPQIHTLLAGAEFRRIHKQVGIGQLAPVVQ